MVAHQVGDNVRTSELPRLQGDTIIVQQIREKAKNFNRNTRPGRKILPSEAKK